MIQPDHVWKELAIARANYKIQGVIKSSAVRVAKKTSISQRIVTGLS